MNVADANGLNFSKSSINDRVIDESIINHKNVEEFGPTNSAFIPKADLTDTQNQSSFEFIEPNQSRIVESRLKPIAPKTQGAAISFVKAKKKKKRTKKSVDVESISNDLLNKIPSFPVSVKKLIYYSPKLICFVNFCADSDAAY